MNSIYNRQKIELQKTEVLNPQSYRGFSSIASSTSSFTVYDIELIKQDLLNYFNIRKGEKLENPEFGTIIWDMLFDPLTEENKQLILDDVSKIINYDPRLTADTVLITEYEFGLIIDCTVTYLPYYITESLKLGFDRSQV